MALLEQNLALSGKELMRLIIYFCDSSSWLALVHVPPTHTLGLGTAPYLVVGDNGAPLYVSKFMMFIH